MYSLLPVVFGVLAIIVMLQLPLQMEIKDLPALFSDESDGVVELRTDLAHERNADECYRICMLRSYITYAIQRNADDTCELIEVTYRGKPGPTLEIENDRPLRFGKRGAAKQKVHFSPAEQRDIRAFVHTVRTLVANNRAFA